MSTAKVIFAKSYSPGGILLRLFLFSQYNHIAIEFSGQVYDATSHGVVKQTREQFFGRYKRVLEIEVTIPKGQKAVTWLEKQLGKRYDYLAVIAFPFRRNWQKENRWFCSELVAEALILGGYKVRRVPSSRVTPRDVFHML